MKKIRQYLSALCLMSASSVAFAHNDTVHPDFIAGLLHPLSGLDHLLALLLGGVFIARLQQGRLLSLSAFIGSLALGMLISQALGPQAWLESALILSLPIFALLNLKRNKTPHAISVSVFSIFFTVHGWVHGIEMPVIGPAFASALLIGSALVIGVASLLAMPLYRRGTRAHAGH